MIDLKNKKNDYFLVFVVIIIVVIVVSVLIGLRLNEVLSDTVDTGENGKVIIIDPGHGGFDGGATADKIIEKDINLKFSHYSADIFKVLGFDVVMTREDDSGLQNQDAKTLKQMKSSDLHNRLAMFNGSRVALSFHQNKFDKAKYRGAQVFYGSGNEESFAIAVSIKKQIDEMLDPVVKREVSKTNENIFLFRESAAPAILIECGFMSNAEDLKLIQDSAYQKKFAFAVTCGILDYGLFNANPS